MEFRLLVETSSPSSQSGQSTITLQGRHWHLTEELDILDESSIPNYVCLSYRWGPNREWNEYIKPGYIPDQTIPALATAIRSSTASAFWTDVFCVPREEHRRQATLESMGFIYSRASQVIVVLSGSSFDAVKQISKADALDESSINILEKDDWVKSVWTHQEIMNSREVHFVCGDAERTIVGDQFLNGVGYALTLYKKKYDLDYFDICERYPNMSALEDLIASYMINDYIKAPALQLMANLDKCTLTEPQNYFYSMMGMITQEPSSWARGSSIDAVSETFMALCERKNDYSFIYTTAPRDKTPGRRWRPIPGIFPTVLSWHLIGTTQQGHYDSDGFWLHGMARLSTSSRLGEVGKQHITGWLRSPELAEQGVLAIAEKTYDTLKRIGFTGSEDFYTTETGLFYPHESLPSYAKITILVSTELQWTLGAPGFARNEIEGSWAYVPGVFVGSIKNIESCPALIDSPPEG